MIPAPLTHKKEGVLHRLDIPKSIEGVQNILPAVYRGVIQIAQQILQQQALPVSDGRLERGDHIGKKRLLHYVLFLVRLRKSQNRRVIFFEKGHGFSRLGLLPAFDGLIKSHKFLHIFQPAEDFFGIPNRGPRHKTVQIFFPMPDSPLLPLFDTA